MFTGIIAETGTIRSIKQLHGGLRISVGASRVPKRLKTGDSVAVSGVCLTAVNIKPHTFDADLAQETVARTSLAGLKSGATVNLELPMKAGSPLGGHIVQGHVDGTAKLRSMTRVQGAKDWRMVLELPAGLAHYVVNKGSITVEGISLTVAKIAGRKVEIAVIPHTYEVTNLKTRGVGDLLNIEVDVLAKYAEKRSPSARGGVTAEQLLSEGF